MVSQDDAAAAVVAALEVPGGVYNVVDDDPVRRGDLVNAIADAIGVRHPRFLPSWVALLSGSVGRTIARSVRVSNAKLKSASSWKPGFANTIDGWRAMM